MGKSEDTLTCAVPSSIAMWKTNLGEARERPWGRPSGDIQAVGILAWIVPGKVSPQRRAVRSEGRGNGATDSSAHGRLRCQSKLGEVLLMLDSAVNRQEHVEGLLGCG